MDIATTLRRLQRVKTRMFTLGVWRVMWEIFVYGTSYYYDH